MSYARVTPAGTLVILPARRPPQQYITAWRALTAQCPPGATQAEWESRRQAAWRSRSSVGTEQLDAGRFI
jgi:hypothetical protein